MPSTLFVADGKHDDASHPQGATLRWAVAKAQDGDTIVITGDAARTGITLTQGDVTLTQKNLTIETDPKDPAATIHAAIYSRIFDVAAGAQVTLSDLTLTGGDDLYEGGAISNAGNLTINDSAVSGNRCHSIYGGAGGGIFNVGTLTINDSNVSGNVSLAGGGILNNGTLTINASTLSDNRAGDGSGICQVAGTLTINGSTLSDNGLYAPGVPDYYGGGLEIQSGLATINDSTLSHNSAGFGGSGIANFGGTLAIANSTLSENINALSFSPGGGILNWGVLTVINSKLYDNRGWSGGGIANFGTATISGSILSGNSAVGGDGGGIWVFSGPLTLSNCILSNNSASGDGGGIFNYYGSVTVTGCTLTGNSADIEGGGIYNALGATLTVSDSTFSANTPDNIFGSYVDGGGNTFA